MSELDYRRWTSITRLVTLVVLISILIMLAYWLPILGQAAHIYITMYG
jgi:competence protein ComGF